MAKHVLYNASVVANSVDLSDHDNKIEFTVQTNGQDAAAMGEAEDYQMAGTRKVSPIQCEFFQDYASGKVYATLMALWTARSTFTLVLKADAGATATTNPQFTVTVFIANMPVISGTRGDRHMTNVTFQPASALAIATL